MDIKSDKGFTVWFTGLPGSGKTTASQMVSETLRNCGLKVEVLDGDVIRKNLSKGLGYSKEDRDTNIRRIGFVCHLLSRNGVAAIAAAIAPYKEIREENRKLIGNYVEIFMTCSMDELIRRDPKGLYKKAIAGEIKHFTGVSDPYELPENPEVVCDTGNETPKESHDKIIAKLEELGFIEP
jgi:adenylyl-sulfate kinase